MHAAYMLVATIYAVVGRCKRWFVVVCAIITLGIWWTAVYSCHHYIIDVLLGIATAIVGVVVFEQILMRWQLFRQFIQRYTQYVS